LFWQRLATDAPGTHKRAQHHGQRPSVHPLSRAFSPPRTCTPAFRVSRLFKPTLALGPDTYNPRFLIQSSRMRIAHTVTYVQTVQMPISGRARPNHTSAGSDTASRSSGSRGGPVRASHTLSGHRQRRPHQELTRRGALRGCVPPVRAGRREAGHPASPRLATGCNRSLPSG